MISAGRTRVTQQERSTARQQLMRDTAARLLIDEGPSGVSHRRVASAAGLPTGSATYYFPSKAALYEAAVAAAEDVRVAAATERAASLPQRERGAAATARLLLETFYAPDLRPDVVHVRLEPMLDATRTPGLAEIMRASRPRLLTALRTVLRRCGYTAVADGPDLELLATTIDAGLLYANGSGEDDPIDAACSFVARLLELASR